MREEEKEKAKAEFTAWIHLAALVPIPRLTSRLSSLSPPTPELLSPSLLCSPSPRDIKGSLTLLALHPELLKKDTGVEKKGCCCQMLLVPGSDSPLTLTRAEGIASNE